MAEQVNCIICGEPATQPLRMQSCQKTTETNYCQTHFEEMRFLFARAVQDKLLSGIVGVLKIYYASVPEQK